MIKKKSPDSQGRPLVVEIDTKTDKRKSNLQKTETAQSEESIKN